MIAYILIPQVLLCRGMRRIFDITMEAHHILCREVTTELTNLLCLLSMNDEIVLIFSLDFTIVIFNVFKYYYK